MNKIVENSEVSLTDNVNLVLPEVEYRGFRYNINGSSGLVIISSTGSISLMLAFILLLPSAIFVIASILVGILVIIGALEICKQIIIFFAEVLFDLIYSSTTD